MWAKVVLFIMLTAVALLALAEMWLRLRRRASLNTPPDALRPSTASLEWPDVEQRLRLVALGDSIVNGHLVPEPRAWPARLEQRLRARHPDTDWTVVNSGICGETVLQGLARLQRDALRLQPQALFIAFGLNDCYLARSTTDVWREVETFPERTYGPLGGSRVYRAARRRILQEEPPWKQAVPDWQPRVEPEAFVSALERMVRAAQGAGVQHTYLLTMTPVADGAHSYWPPEVQALQVATYHRFNDRVRESAAALGVGLIDAKAGFAGSDLAQMLDFDGIHLTAAGQQRLAEIVFSALDQDGTLATLRQL